MDERRPDHPENAPATEAWGAIAAFEGILEVMPDDCGAMDALVQSYEMVGEHARARQYLIRLARAHLAQFHTAEAPELIARLRAADDGGAEIAALVKELESLQTAAAPAAERSARPAPSAGTERQTALQAELSFAWRLHEKKMLTPEEYALVVQDLTEVSSRPSDLTVSVLHVLQDRSFRNLESILAFVAKDTRLPMVPVSSFDPQESTFGLLPMDFIRRRGAIPFESLAAELLVGVLNPYDEVLRADVQRLAGRPCHFYLVHPSEFDAWMNRVKDLRK